MPSQNLTATATSSPLDLPLSSGDGARVQVKTYHVAVYGTFDTATATLQFSPDGGTTWIATSVSVTSETLTTIDLPGGENTQVRWDVSGAGTNTDLNLDIRG